MKRWLNSKIFTTTLRIILGLLFFFSALAKLKSMDSFELYIFSLNVFGFNTSSLLARLIISFEFLLAALFFINIYFKWVFRLTLGTLLAFSVFLLFRLSFDENCNCFGELLPMNPLESLIKNVIFIVLLSLLYFNKGWQWRFQKAALIALSVISLTVPLVISPPDIIHNRLYGHPLPLHTADGSQHITISDNSLDYANGKKVLNFFSLNCPYCLLAAQKISIIAEQQELTEDIYFYFFGDEDAIGDFWEQSQSVPMPYAFIPFEEVIRLSDGRLPTIYFTENGKIVARYDYRSFTDRDFARFFNNN